MTVNLFRDSLEEAKMADPPTNAHDRSGNRPDAASRRVPRILLAEDDYELRRLLSEVLREAGYDIVEAKDGHQLRDRLDYSRLLFEDRYDFDLIVSDIRMPGLTGLDALSSLPRRVVVPPVILITAFGDRDAFRQAAAIGAIAFFDKPIDLDEFRRFVGGFLSSGSAETESDIGI
jgi:DNA-binding NtrC family response regulator